MSRERRDTRNMCRGKHGNDSDACVTSDTGVIIRTRLCRYGAGDMFQVAVASSGSCNTENRCHLETNMKQGTGVQSTDEAGNKRSAKWRKVPEEFSGLL